MTSQVDVVIIQQFGIFEHPTSNSDHEPRNRSNNSLTHSLIFNFGKFYKIFEILKLNVSVITSLGPVLKDDSRYYTENETKLLPPGSYLENKNLFTSKIIPKIL